MSPVSLSEKFALITEHWRPRVAASLNGQALKLVKFTAYLAYRASLIFRAEKLVAR